MPTDHPLKTDLAANSLAFIRLLPMTILALAIVSATACSDRAAPEAVAGTAPAAATPADHQGAHAGVPKDTVAPQDAHASHPPAGASAPVLPATPWASDAPLREGMHRGVDALGHVEHDHLDVAQTSAAANQVQAAAEFMITNCKLAPEPDAALHGLLATLMTGAAAIKHDPTDTTPVQAMRDALALYPRMFQDPAWQADTAPWTREAAAGRILKVRKTSFPGPGGGKSTEPQARADIPAACARTDRSHNAVTRAEGHPMRASGAPAAT